MSEHYDVIIIGTGAGGGTLAHRLAPVRQAHPAARARRLPAARARELGLQRGLRARSATSRRERWYDKHGDAFRPQAQYYVGRQHQVLRRDPVPASASATSARSTTTAASRPAWPISYADLEPYYAEAERLYLVHGERGEDPTEPPRSGPFPYPGRLARAADPAAARRPRARPATTRSTCPSAIDLDESDPEKGRCVRCDRFDGFPCLDGRQGRRARALRPARRSRTRTSRSDALQGGAAGDRRVAGARSRGSSSTRGGREETYSADVVVVSCGAVNSAALLLRSANDRHPNGLANSLRRRRPPLHGAHQLGA